MFGKKKKRLEISAPSNFEHRVHTGFDPREQKFTGLPQQWQSLLADTANRPKPMVDPSYITPIQLAPMKVECDWTDGIKTGDKRLSFSVWLTRLACFSPPVTHPSLFWSCSTTSVCRRSIRPRKYLPLQCPCTVCPHFILHLLHKLLFFPSEAKQLTLQCHLATSHNSNCRAVCNNNYYIALNLH